MTKMKLMVGKDLKFYDCDSEELQKYDGINDVHSLGNIQSGFGVFYGDICIKDINLISKEDLVALSEYGNLHIGYEGDHFLEILSHTGIDNVPVELGDLITKLEKAYKESK